MNIILKRDLEIYLSVACFEILGYFIFWRYSKAYEISTFGNILMLCLMLAFFCIVPFSYYLLYKKDKKASTILLIKDRNYFDIFFKRTCTLFFINMSTISMTLVFSFITKTNSIKRIPDIRDLLMASIYFFLYLGPFFLLLFYISIFIVVCLLFKDKRAITAYMLVGLSVITQIDSFIIFNWEAKVAIQLIFPISLLLLLLVAGFQIMNWLFEDGFEL